MGRREYIPCFGNQCSDDEDNDNSNVSYSRLDNSSDQARLVNNGSRQRKDECMDENDYFRPVDSYQRNPADGDQGQEPDEIHADEGTHNYTGVHVQGRTNKKASKRKGFRAYVQHIMHSSWKWFKRGFIFVAPTVTAGMSFNPATAYVISSVARGEAIKGSTKTRV